MTDREDTRPMDDDRSEQHPDEGTIHAWLDGALDGAATDALAAHVASCRACAERVAEARGLIAGASRIVRALDERTTSATPAWGQAAVPATTAAVREPGSGSVWRLLRVTPARAAIAATLLVALGVSLTYTRAAVDSEAVRESSLRSEMAREADGGSATSSAAAGAPVVAAAPAAAPRGDALLDSAVARNLAVAQPPRAVKAAPGLAVPVPEPAASGAVVGDVAASRRVAVGRATVQAQRESLAGTSPDQLAARSSGVANPARAEETVAARRAENAAIPTAPAAAPADLRLRGTGATPAPECYRVESASGATATWGTVALPLVIAVDAPDRARVLTVAGQPTEASARVSSAGDDSLRLSLRRIGYEGTLTLGAAAETRAGVMRSRPTAATLSQVVTSSAAPESAEARRQVTPQRRIPVRRDVARDSAAAPPPRAAAADAAAAESAVRAAPAVPVVARRVPCPR